MNVQDFILSHHVVTSGEEFTANDICRNYSVDRKQVRSLLAVLCERGQLQRINTGRYCSTRPATKWIRRRWV